MRRIKRDKFFVEEDSLIIEKGDGTIIKLTGIEPISIETDIKLMPNVVKEVNIKCEFEEIHLNPKLQEPEDKCIWVNCEAGWLDCQRGVHGFIPSGGVRCPICNRIIEEDC